MKKKLIVLSIIIFSINLFGYSCEKIDVTFFPFAVTVTAKDVNTYLIYTGRQCDWSECFSKYENFDYVLYKGGEENFTSFQNKHDKRVNYCIKDE